MDHYWSQAPETAAIIREPLDWLGSWYRYRRRSELLGTPQSTADVSFAKFVETYLLQDKTPFAHVGQQSKFLKNASKDYPMHLWRYDDLEGLKKFLGDQLSVKIKLPHLNASEDLELDLPKTLRKEAEAFFKDDYQLYENAKHA